MDTITEGFDAYNKGLLKEVNPYSPGTSQYADWNIGWEDAREQYYKMFSQFWDDYDDSELFP